MSEELATFAAGCFWGVEADFRNIPGVFDTVVGYTGGQTENPTYQEVCTHTTGHAEAVRVSFDTEKISFEQLVEAFFDLHDPTTQNRQGPDVGSQYRSAIFYHNETQKQTAEAVKQALDQSGKYSWPIVTQIVPAGPFYTAEKYHQRYYEKHSLRHC
jgi:peptide-methionine (S)-S-oxide reductase